MFTHTKFLILLFLLLTTSFYSFSNETDAEPYRVLTVPFSTTQGADKSDTDTIFMLLNAELADLGGSELQLLEPPASEALMEEQNFQLTGFTSDSELIDFSQRLDANLVLTGFCALFGEELIVAVIIYETDTGHAISGRTQQLREEAFLSDLGLLAGELWADLLRHKQGVEEVELKQLISMGYVEEAARLEPMLPEENTVSKEEVSQQIRAIKSENLLNELATFKDSATDRTIEDFFLLMSLTEDNTLLSEVGSRLFSAYDSELERKIESYSTLFNEALSAQRFEEAEKLLAEIEHTNASPQLIVSKTDEFKKTRLKTLLSRSLWSLLRRENRSAAYYGYQALAIDPQNSTAVERTIKAQERLEADEYTQLINEAENDSFVFADRSGILLELSIGYGVTDDALAKLAEQGIGFSSQVSAYLHKELLPPVQAEFGFQAAMAEREGGLYTTTETIDITANLYEAEGSVGILARFFSYDFGLRLRGGGALLFTNNAGEKLTTPAVTFSPELFTRYYVSKETLFIGASISSSKYMSFGNPAVDSLDFILSAGWSF